MKKLIESIDKTGEFAKSKAYADYCDLVAETERLIEEQPQSDTYSASFFHKIELYLRYGNFKKLGQGSSRTAYSFNADPRYVLKFAHNDNGMKQNQTEIKNANLGSGDYSCVVRILDYAKSGVFIIEDNCRESSFDDWKRILGISAITLAKIVRIVLERRKKDHEYSLNEFYEEIQDPAVAADVFANSKDPRWIPFNSDYLYTDQPKILHCLKNLLAAAGGKTVAEKYQALYDMFRFYFDNGEGALIPTEIMYPEQWGVRPGKTPDEDSLIIIDPGVDSDFMPDVGKNGRVR